MTAKRIVPKDPLGFIQVSVKRGQVLWTYHVNMRLKGRSIARESILRIVESFEIIESYPEDKYLPSYLVHAQIQGDVFHVLFATDVPEQNVRIVTAYRPDPAEWSADLRRRR
ncbi:MAG TPA: DUF4258 domain-containing protein [Thermoanaerobaculia bacterium]|nr:DUF4258 domain-containing protein [Thermoanaerobaculia bacterium]